MPIILMTSRPTAPAERPAALELTEALTGTVGGFLEVSQMLTGRVPERELILDTYLTGEVPGVPMTAHLGAVLDLSMTAGGLPVESFQYSAARGQGARLDVTVIGDARDGQVPPVSASAGGSGATFAAPGTLPEWEAERTAAGWTTTLHASDRSLAADTPLPELVPWETQEAKDARKAQEQALRVAKVPVAQREAALYDGRRMAVDAVVLAALATVPHRLLISPPFPGYDFRADGDGPSYSTAGKTAQEVVDALWGEIGIAAGWEAGLLTIRPPGPSGDVILGAPIESERIERITLDAPTIALEGGVPAQDPATRDDDEDGTPNGQDPDWAPDPNDPDDPRNSPDPDEREDGGDGRGGSGFREGVSPTPEPGEVSARAVPLSWEAVPHASQYVLERVEGAATPWTLWSRLAITTATRHTDDTVRPLTTYTYRLRVNATAIENDEERNVIWQPSEWALVVTPPVDVDAPPNPPENLTAYARTSTSVGVQWQAPKADPEDKEPPRRGPADRYRVDVRTRTPDATLLRRVETAQTWAVPDGLPVGAEVRVQVYAVNEQGLSEPALLDAQLVNLPPGPVEGLEVKAEGKTLTATWERASGATSFDVRWAPAVVGDDEGALRWKDLPPIPVPTVPRDGEGGRPSVVLRDLKHATRYAVQVRGLNDVGVGVWSEVAYELTESEPPQPEPDPEADAFEKGYTGVLRMFRHADDQTEHTFIGKVNGRVEWVNTSLWGKVPRYRRTEKDKEEKIGYESRWSVLKATSTRYFYEIPGWPLTLTSSVEETRLWDPDATVFREGVDAVIGREQEKVHQEWSPQGWLNRRTTWRSKVSVVKVKKDDEGEVIGREYGNMHETVREQWQAAGDGLWYYNRSGVMTTLLPTLVDDEWEDVEAGFKATPSETSVSEQAPPQATLPPEKKDNPPPLPRNETSPALERYPLDEPWFETPPASGPGGDGPSGGPEDGEEKPDPKPPKPAPGREEDPISTPFGSSDPSGRPAPDRPKGTVPARAPLQISQPAPGATVGGNNGATLSATLPWVRTAEGLARYAAYMAQQGGPRYRITRTYLLPTTPPSLDRVESISASGSAGQFSMTVVTETR
ncbi:hypothetical protein SAMN04488058_101286 [Deinococcus reticulitermitis]|uniref:Fibronectin type-III domain-containing protein n=1 Tax=Deinococcus reticulitermitis TaxID=856736 RepID=A0A1H6SPA8_9DEIO|nr:fibronectin type III domain-containing protein [Deinococcus reticulitermitis]SEI66617.1 hypothetical protein SAMN04488058_101286 [Deinococcus reticulitermitis]